MKNLKSLFVALALVFAMSFDASAKSEQLSLNADMHCGSCKTKIEKTLKTLDGIEKTDINVEAKTVNLTYDSDKISKDKIVSTISDLGYNASEAKACSTEKKDAKCSTAEKTNGKSCCTDKKDGKACSTEKKDCK